MSQWLPLRVGYATREAAFARCPSCLSSVPARSSLRRVVRSQFMMDAGVGQLFPCLSIVVFGVAMADTYIQPQQPDLNMPVHLKKQHSLLGVISLVCAIIAFATSAILIGMRPV